MRPVALLALIALTHALSVSAAELGTYTVSARISNASYEATGTVEAVREATLAAQVVGRVSQVLVHSGDFVKKDALLAQIEAGESLDSAAASSFGAAGSAARLASARTEYERAQQLRAQDFISVAAMQRAEAAWRSAAAEAQATGAQARAAKIRSDWYSIKAPFAGHVTRLSVSVGDLAIQGSPLLSMYDPTELRLIVHVPETIAVQLASGQSAVLIASDVGSAVVPAGLGDWLIIPAVDPATRSVEVRVQLPAGVKLEPGQLARLRLPLQSSAAQLRIPVSATLRRSELTGVYVVGADGMARLRQVRLGPIVGDEVVVLAGLQSGERVARDPIAAVRH
jgi:RND family efflux transporter MFP subunit